jgi:hypothetical protein
MCASMMPAMHAAYDTLRFNRFAHSARKILVSARARPQGQTEA